VDHLDAAAPELGEEKLMWRIATLSGTTVSMTVKLSDPVTLSMSVPTGG
jgi:hypothetical protein